MPTVSTDPAQFQPLPARPYCKSSFLPKSAFQGAGYTLPGICALFPKHTVKFISWVISRSTVEAFGSSIDSGALANRFVAYAGTRLMAVRVSGLAFLALGVALVYRANELDKLEKLKPWQKAIESQLKEEIQAFFSKMKGFDIHKSFNENLVEVTDFEIQWELQNNQIDLVLIRFYVTPKQTEGEGGAPSSGIQFSCFFRDASKKVGVNRVFFPGGKGDRSGSYFLDKCNDFSVSSQSYLYHLFSVIQRYAELK